MAPTRTMAENEAVGVTTRSRQGAGLKSSLKRKAGSPPRDCRAAAKRAAFGDITNAVVNGALNGQPFADDRKKAIGNNNAKKKKGDSNESKKVKVQKKTTTAAASLFGGVQSVWNLKRAVQNKSSATFKVACDAKAPDKTARRSNGRQSEQFSEDSLYVSAVDDMLTDAKSDTTVTSVKNEKEPSLTRDINLLAIHDKETPTVSIPEGVVDFDAENWNDPFQVSHYAMDIFDYLKTREASFKIEDYLPRQGTLTAWMRALLVDWMVEVQESFELNHETLYLAVKLVDLYLCREVTKKDELQLLGAASLLIAAKFDERIPPLIDDFLYICDGAYKLEQLLKMEIDVLRVIGFDIGIPLSYRFLRRYARCAKVSMPTLTLARFILELCLMEYSMIPLSDSKMAAAALFLAIKMKNLGTWTATHEYYTGYKLQDILPVVRLQNMCLHKKPKEALSTVRNKYSHRIFFEVAKVPLIANEHFS